MNPEYIALCKEAKKRKIDNMDDLDALVSEMYEGCTGGEYECLRESLKISRW